MALFKEARGGAVSTVHEACEPSGGSAGQAGVPQGLLEARFTPQLLVQRLDGLLGLGAPAWLWMRRGRRRGEGGKEGVMRLL